MDATRISLCPATSGQSQQYRSQHSVAGRESRRARRAGPEIVRRRGRHPYPSKLASRAVRRAAAPGAMTTSGRPRSRSPRTPSPPRVARRTAAPTWTRRRTSRRTIRARPRGRAAPRPSRLRLPRRTPGPGPPNPSRHINRGLLPDRRGTPRRRPRGRASPRRRATARPSRSPRATRWRACRRAATRGWRDALATLCPDVPREAVDRAHARCVRREERRGDEATGRPPVGDGSEDAESAASSVSVTPAAFCDAFRDEIRSVADPTADATGSPESDAFAAHEARIRRFADATRRREAEAEAALAAWAAREARARARADGRDARGAERPRGAAAASAARLLRRDGHEPPP